MVYPGSPTGPDEQQPGPGPVPPPPPGPPAGEPVASAPDPAAQPLEYVDAAEPAIVPGRRRGLLAGGIAAAVLLIVPGSVLAWQALDGGGTQPHDVLPEDAIGYVRLDLDPSAGQKIEAFRFLQNFPSFTEATGITDEDVDLRERFIDELAEAGGCDLDFASDVEPWVGERVGAAMLPPSGEDGQPGFVVALQASDEDAAIEAIDRILDCGGADAEADGLGRAYVDGYLLVTDTQENADAYAAADSSLADNPEFVEAMDLLGEQGIASAWFSGSAMFDAFDDAGAFGMDMGPDAPGGDLPSLDDARDAVDEAYRSIAVSVRFDDRYAELASVVTGSAYQELDGGGVDADVPDDTALFLGTHDAGQYLRDNWETSLESIPEGADMLADLEAQTGIVLPDDLATVLGEEFVVAADASDLDADDPDGLFGLQFGARVVTDPDAFSDLWERVQALAADSGATLDASLDGLPLQITDDGYVLATSDEYADALLDGGDLAGTDAYRTAVAGADDADSVLFVNVGAVSEQLLAAGGDSLGDAERQSIEALQALGMAMHIDDGHLEFSLRVTTD